MPSIPEMRGRVPRFKQLRVTGLGRHGEALDFIASDFHARVIQHETDHLNGEVYLDRMPNMRSLSHPRRNGIASRWGPRRKSRAGYFR